MLNYEYSQAERSSAHALKMLGWRYQRLYWIKQRLQERHTLYPYSCYMPKHRILRLTTRIELLFEQKTTRMVLWLQWWEAKQLMRYWVYSTKFFTSGRLDAAKASASGDVYADFFIPSQVARIKNVDVRELMLAFTRAIFSIIGNPTTLRYPNRSEQFSICGKNNILPFIQYQRASKLNDGCAKVRLASAFNISETTQHVWLEATKYMNTEFIENFEMLPNCALAEKVREFWVKHGCMYCATNCTNGANKALITKFKRVSNFKVFRGGQPSNNDLQQPPKNDPWHSHEALIRCPSSKCMSPFNIDETKWIKKWITIFWGPWRTKV